MNNENETDLNNPMLSIEMDPLEKTYSFRIPLITCNEIEKLSRVQKKQLNEDLLKTMDYFLHNALYVPGKHLKSEHDE